MDNQKLLFNLIKQIANHLNIIIYDEETNKVASYIEFQIKRLKAKDREHTEHIETKPSYTYNQIEQASKQYNWHLDNYIISSIGNKIIQQIKDIVLDSDNTLTICGQTYNSGTARGCIKDELTLDYYIEYCDSITSEIGDDTNILLNGDIKFIHSGDSMYKPSLIGYEPTIKYLVDRKCPEFVYDIFARRAEDYILYNIMPKGSVYWTTRDIADILIEKSGRIRTILGIQSGSNVSNYDIIKTIINEIGIEANLSTSDRQEIRIMCLMTGADVYGSDAIAYRIKGNSVMRSIALAHLDKIKMFNSLNWRTSTLEESIKDVGKFEAMNVNSIMKSIDNYTVNKIKGVKISEQEINKLENIFEQRVKGKNIPW